MQREGYLIETWSGRRPVFKLENGGGIETWPGLIEGIPLSV